MQIQRYADLEALSRAAVADFAELVAATSSPFHVALSGGSTPKKLFELFRAMGRAALPWDRIHLWWGDDRCVPPDSPDSNYGIARALLIEPLGIDPANVHRIHAEDDAEAAAAAYEAELVRVLGAPPVLDLLWLGMGPDGHTASLFPHSPALDERTRFCVANPIDSPLAGGKSERITMTYTAFAAAKHTRFLAAGKDKAETLARVLTGPPAHHTLPSQGVTGADLRWFVDEAAAARLA